MSAADEIRSNPRYRNAIARAELEAAGDVALGVQNLKAELATAPEWAEAWSTDGRRTRVEPRRQMLAGHLRRIEAVR